MCKKLFFLFIFYLLNIHRPLLHGMEPSKAAQETSALTEKEYNNLCTCQKEVFLLHGLWLGHSFDFSSVSHREVLYHYPGTRPPKVEYPPLPALADLLRRVQEQQENVEQLRKSLISLDTHEVPDLEPVGLHHSKEDGADQLVAQKYVALEKDQVEIEILRLSHELESIAKCIQRKLRPVPSSVGLYAQTAHAETVPVRPESSEMPRKPSTILKFDPFR